jgi:hypothetical protein
MSRFVPPLPLHLAELGDPLRALLVLSVVVSKSIPKELQELIGIHGIDVEAVEKTYGHSISRLRELQLTAELLSPQQVGQWIVARIGEMTLGASTPGQLAACGRALSKLPEWISDPELHELERTTRKAECSARMHSASRRGEALSPPSARARNSAAPSAVPADHELQKSETSAFEPAEIKSPELEELAEALNLPAECTSAAFEEMQNPETSQIQAPKIKSAALHKTPKRSQRQRVHR